MQVLIPSALHSYTRAARIEASGPSVDALLRDLDLRHPGIRFRIVDEQDRLRANMRIFVNGQGVRDLAHRLRADDDVAIVQALSGG